MFSLAVMVLVSDAAVSASPRPVAPVVRPRATVRIVKPVALRMVDGRLRVTGEVGGARQVERVVTDFDRVPRRAVLVEFE